MEAQVAEDSRAKVKNQNYLELDTAERVVTRVRSWTTSFLFFAGIPLTIAAFAFAILFGKNAWDLNRIAANAKSDIEGVLNEAKSKGVEAKSTATDALNTSKQVGSEIHETQRRVAELNTLVQSRISEAQKLNTQIEASQSQIDALRRSVDAESQKVVHLAETVKAVETQKNVLAVRETYPLIYGAHVVRSGGGQIIDAKGKSASDIYVLVALWESANTSATVGEAKFAAALEGLRERNFTTFLRGLYLQATSGNSSASVSWIGAGGCDVQGVSIGGPPCIIYFKEELKEKASQIKALFAPAQTISDDRVRFVSPKTMSSSDQEIVQKAGLDVLVVLGTH